MAVSKTEVFFQRDIQDVWSIVTSLEHYQWRSDISKVEIISDKQFVEYTKDGYATKNKFHTFRRRLDWVGILAGCRD